MQKLESTSFSNFNHSYKINWLKVGFYEKYDLGELVFKMMLHIGFHDSQSPMQYKNTLNNINNRFYKHNIESIISMGKEEKLTHGVFNYTTDDSRVLARDNCLYKPLNDEEKLRYELYKAFENSYWNILNLSKDEYAEHLKEHPHLKDNWFKYFKDIMSNTDDVSSVFVRFNIFEYPTTVFEMIELIDLIKDKKCFNDYFNLVLENKNIDLSNLLELVSIYNKDDISKNKDFFDLKTVWKLIDNKNLNDDCLEFLPDMLRSFDLKESQDGVNYIGNSMEKIFFIEDLTLERYKLLEKTFNLESLDNSLFDMTKVLGGELSDKDRTRISKYFDFTLLKNYKDYSVNDEKYKLNDNTYKVLNYVINNMDINFEIYDDSSNRIKSISLCDEYIDLFNNTELFDYIYKKYEKTINKEAMLIVFGNIIVDGVKNVDNILNKYDYDITDYNFNINGMMFNLLNQRLYFIGNSGNSIKTSMYHYDSLVDINSKLKIKIDDETYNKSMRILNNSINYYSDFDDVNSIKHYDVAFNKILYFYKSIEFEKLDETMNKLIKRFDTDTINQYQKYLIENNNKFDLELFDKILIDSGINQVQIQNDNEIKIKKNNRF